MKMSSSKIMALAMGCAYAAGPMWMTNDAPVRRDSKKIKTGRPYVFGSIKKRKAELKATRKRQNNLDEEK